MVPGLNLVIGLMMAISATITEAFIVRIGSFKIDDNLSIPLVSAVVGLLCYMLFLPDQIPFLSISR